MVTARIATLSRNDTRRPIVSASTPVGISNTTLPAVNAAFATNTPKMLSPASSRNSVLTPQISAAANVYSPAIRKYPVMTRRDVMADSRVSVAADGI